MVWQGFSGRLKEVLGLEGSPVAVSYSMGPLGRGKEGRHWVCGALLDARDGATVNLSAENSACRGGTWHLGLGPRPSGEAYRALQKFLVEGEKICGTITAFNRMQALTTAPPLGLADFVVFSPLERAELRPDLVVFLCNPEQACRLLTLATFPDGLPPRVELLGSTCHMVVAYPIVSGELNVSLMDYTSRKHRPYRKEELFVSIPYHKMGGLMESIERSTAGTAPVEYPPEFRRLFREEAEEIAREGEGP